MKNNNEDRLNMSSMTTKVGPDETLVFTNAGVEIRSTTLLSYTAAVDTKVSDTQTLTDSSSDKEHTKDHSGGGFLWFWDTSKGKTRDTENNSSLASSSNSTQTSNGDMKFERHLESKMLAMGSKLVLNGRGEMQTIDGDIASVTQEYVRAQDSLMQQTHDDVKKLVGGSGRDMIRDMTALGGGDANKQPKRLTMQSGLTKRIGGPQ